MFSDPAQTERREPSHLIFQPEIPIFTFKWKVPLVSGRIFHATSFLHITYNIT